MYSPIIMVDALAAAALCCFHKQQLLNAANKCINLLAVTASICS